MRVLHGNSDSGGADTLSRIQRGTYTFPEEPATSADAKDFVGRVRVGLKRVRQAIESQNKKQCDVIVVILVFEATDVYTVPCSSFRFVVRRDGRAMINVCCVVPLGVLMPAMSGLGTWCSNVGAVVTRTLGDQIWPNVVWCCSVEVNACHHAALGYPVCMLETVLWPRTTSAGSNHGTGTG